MSEPVYSVDFFLAKFSAIPEELWCVNEYVTKDGKKRCSAAWCFPKRMKRNKIVGDFMLVRTTPELDALRALLEPVGSVEEINNGDVSHGDHIDNEPTPKLRILAALEDVKRKETK